MLKRLANGHQCDIGAFNQSMRFGFIRGMVAGCFAIVTFAALCQTEIQPIVYPKIVGYFSFVSPLTSHDKNGWNSNFKNGYTLGFPTGINIIKSETFAFSFELTPFIHFQNGSSKTSNILFHPGVIRRFSHGFSITGRLAFESSGRYGTTVIFTKTVIRTASNNYFIAIPVPARFGNDKPFSLGVSLQAGVTF